MYTIYIALYNVLETLTFNFTNKIKVKTFSDIVMSSNLS